MVEISQHMKPAKLFYTSALRYLLPIVLLCCILLQAAQAQRPSGMGAGRFDGQGRPMGPNSKMKGGDSLQQRNNNEDSITIFYRMFDSSRIRFLDSTVGEFSMRFPLQKDQLFLGSLGNAAQSLLFQPNMKPGFDPGFHAYDIYKYSIEGTRIFQTTRPYTELDYLLGARSEQTIKALHTQNISPTWNASFEFRYLGTPGNFKNNNTSHSNIRLATGFATRNRRYSGNAIYITNRNRSATNGGIVSDTFLTSNNQAYTQRFNIPTWLGEDGDVTANPFATNVKAGHDYKQRLLYFRHQYDFGQKDSVLNINDEDSSYTKVFYPRFRIQHSLLYNNQQFGYKDEYLTDTAAGNAYAQVYRHRFGVQKFYPQFLLNDRWAELTNEAAILLYPQKNNQDQFLKMGAGLQLLNGSFDSATKRKYSNSYLLGEYRNRTRNRKWDINAHGRLFLSGINAGDYTVDISLQTQLGKRAGTLQLGFVNTNRTPSFVFDTLSGFINQTVSSLKQENWTKLSGQYYLPKLRLQLFGNYYLVSNYTYWDSYTTFKQEATLTTVLHVGAAKTFALSKHWNWHTSLHIQTEASKVINLPVLYSQNRIAYEGNFYKNLLLSTGVEVRYYTAYTMNDFSPMNGQWVVQDTAVIRNKPDIHAYLHFRIRSFRLFTRLENLNTLSVRRGFAFVNNNLAAPLYPTPGLFFRLGIYWGFVN